MGKGFFVTATDTGVGKTVVAAAIIRILKRCGLSVCGMKPVESGCRREGGILFPADGDFLRTASEAEEPLENITPVRFEEPLAPWVAAERAGTQVDTRCLVGKFMELSGRYDAVVAEGIGGILVPIRKDYFVSDLAKDFSLPVIVVAQAYLGTINHTLLTVEHALRAGLKVAGIILNYPDRPGGTVAEETNPGVIEKLAPAPLIGVMPCLEDLSVSSMEKAALESLDLEILRKSL